MGGRDVVHALVRRRAEDASTRGPLMSPLDLALAVLLIVSFAFGVVLLALVTLVLEALLFALGVGRRDWRARN
jgi:hypothetical protein